MKNDPVDPTIRLAIARWPEDASRGAVTAFCTEHEISRNRFYQILKRARTEGQAAALEPHSRRPKTSPNATSESLEESGWDHGPISVHDKMVKLGMHAPSVAVLARIFRERGLIVPAPSKRPRSSFRSFRYPMPNACWQLDATEYVLEGGRKCVIFQLTDDHSRLAISRAHAVDLETACPDEDTAEVGLSEMENTFILLSESERDSLPVAGAGYDVWEEKLAHLGALVAPANRRSGLGFQSVAFAQKHAIDAGLIPQWRVHVDNAASIRTALRAGFEYAGTQTTVILKN